MGKFERTLRKGERPYDYRRHWSLHDRYDTGDHSYPHMIAIVYNGLIESESLVRADLLCAMGIIIDRMRWEWTQSYLVFPVQYIPIPCSISHMYYTDLPRFSCCRFLVVEAGSSKPISMGAYSTSSTRAGTTLWAWTRIP